MEAAIKRELAFAPYADMIWLETKLPDVKQAKYFSRKIREKYPGKSVFHPPSERRWINEFVITAGGSSTTSALVSTG